MLIQVVAFVAALIIYFYCKFQYKTGYWNRHGVQTAGKIVFPLGNTAFLHPDVLKGRKNINDVVREQYEEFKKERFYGTYGPMGGPIIVINDLDLLKTILVKDFQLFADRWSVRKFCGSAKSDIYWKKQLTSLKGEEWKKTRSAFTPMFTAGKLKLMVKFIQAVSNQLVTEIDSHVQADAPMDLKVLLGKFSIDTLAACAFGIDGQSFTNKDSMFAKHVRMIFRKTIRDKLTFLVFMLPGMEQFMSFLGIPVFKAEETTFLTNILKKTLHHRQHSNIRRNDLIDLMIDAMKTEGSESSNENAVGFDETFVIANAMVILCAGYDTTGVAMSYVFYEMAMQPNIQKRLQEEIDEACSAAGDKMPDYNTIQGLEFLDMVMHESLRLYSPAGAISRASSGDYKIPDSNVTIPAGAEVHIPIFGIQRDGRYYETPHEFNPEHFTKEAKAMRHPYAFLAFGGGPRNCIGLRFALLEAKMGMIDVLSKYNIIRCAETPTTITLDPVANLGNCLEPLMVKMEKRASPSIE